MSLQGTNIFSIIGMIVVGLIALPFLLKLVFGLLGIAFSLVGLLINTAVLAVVIYALYRVYQMLTKA